MITKSICGRNGKKILKPDLRRENSMNRVLVIGCSGAGKSTFARNLREKTIVIFHSREEAQQYLDTVHGREQVKGMNA